MDKNEIRNALAAASGAVSIAKNAEHDMQAIFNDVKIKLERAHDARERAEKVYDDLRHLLEGAA